MIKAIPHNLTIYTESAWKRPIVLAMLWIYLLYYSFGRVTYIRVKPNITSSENFTTMNRTYYGCVRFSSTSKLGRWIYTKEHDYSSELGFASTVNNKVYTDE